MDDTISRYETLQALHEAMKGLSGPEKITMQYAFAAVQRVLPCGSVSMEQAVDRLQASGWLDKKYGRQKGTWIPETIEQPEDDCSKEWFRCSGCGMHWEYKYNFCPSCGADMRGEKK